MSSSERRGYRYKFCKAAECPFASLARCGLSHEVTGYYTRKLQTEARDRLMKLAKEDPMRLIQACQMQSLTGF
jgi:hypothetical protein